MCVCVCGGGGEGACVRASVHAFERTCTPLGMCVYNVVLLLSFVRLEVLVVLMIVVLVV